MKNFLELVQKLITVLTNLNLSRIEFEDLIDNIPKFIEDVSFKRRQQVFLEMALCLMKNQRLTIHHTSQRYINLENPPLINNSGTWERLKEALQKNYDRKLSVWWKIPQIKTVDDCREEEPVFVFSACYSMTKTKYQEILEKCRNNEINTRSNFFTALASLEHYVSTPEKFKDVDNVIIPFLIKGHTEIFCLRLTGSGKFAKLVIKRLNVKTYPDKTTIILID